MAESEGALTHRNGELTHHNGEKSDFEDTERLIRRLCQTLPMDLNDGQALIAKNGDRLSRAMLVIIKLLIKALKSISKSSSSIYSENRDS